MRRLGLSAITVLSGAVACGKVWGFDDPILDEGATTTADGGRIVETPVSPADPNRTCVPLPPADWQGPLIIYEGKGDPPPPLPDCLPGYKSQAVYEGNASIVADPPTCHCSCDTPANVGCEATPQYFVSNKCDTPCPGAQDPLKQGGDCSLIPGGCQGIKLLTTASGGTCNGTLKSKDPPAAPRWLIRSRVCAPVTLTQAGCPANRIATPTTSLPFASTTYCIAKSGELECPADQYPTKHVYYEGFLDTRDCDKCGCDPPADAKCAGFAWGYDNAAPACSGGDKAYAADGGCNDVLQQKGARYVPSVLSPGTCTPHPSFKGEATPTTATTICCTR